MKLLEQCDVSNFSHYPSYILRYTCKTYINSILLICLRAGMGSKSLCMVNMLETMLSCELWLTIVYLLSSRDLLQIYDNEIEYVWLQRGGGWDGGSSWLAVIMEYRMVWTSLLTKKGGVNNCHVVCYIYTPRIADTEDKMQWRYMKPAKIIKNARCSSLHVKTFI